MGWTVMEQRNYIIATLTYTVSHKAVISTFPVLQDSVTNQARWEIIPPFSCLLSEKHSCQKLLKSNNVYSSYSYKCWGSFLWDTVYIVNNRIHGYSDQPVYLKQNKIILHYNTQDKHPKLHAKQVCNIVTYTSLTATGIIRYSYTCLHQFKWYYGNSVQ